LNNPVNVGESALNPLNYYENSLPDKRISATEQSKSLRLGGLQMRPVDFVSVGHITHDVVQERYLLGGPCYYSALTAKNLGEKVGMVTNFGKDFHEKNFLAGL